MDFGIQLPHVGRQASRQAIADFARHADELAMHSVWTSDHIVLPTKMASAYPYTDDGALAQAPDTPFVDPIGTLFFAAACTRQVRLGVSVLVLGYRPPILTAKAFASLDVLSEGRAIFGAGIGWMREEFDALSMPYDHRGKRADEQLELLARLFADPLPSYHGEYYDVPEIGFEPKPLARKIPVWIGGEAELALRRVARFGDVYHAAFRPIDELSSAWRRLGDVLDEMDRPRSSVGFSVRLFLDPAGHMPPHKSVAGSPEQMLDTVERLADIGVDHILLDPVARGGVPARRDAMERLMLEVAPRVRS
jgi:probable F420-dependent oxidoreductase